MITAVDTKILLDVLLPGEFYGESSKRLLDAYHLRGSLILCEVVFTELAARFASEDELGLFLADTGMRLVPSSEKSLYIAASRWAEYARLGRRHIFSCGECGKSFTVNCPHCKAALNRRQIVLSEFLIGAHALENADCLLSRDSGGIYKNYFGGLKVIDELTP